MFAFFIYIEIHTLNLPLKSVKPQIKAFQDFIVSLVLFKCYVYDAPF